MTPRVFNREDADAAHELHKLCFPDPWPAHAFMALLETGAQGFILAEGPQADGAIMFRSVCGEAEILTFAVSPRERRRGYGTLLMASAIDCLKVLNVSRLFLEVAANNSAAKQFYKNLHFTVVGERAGYYVKNGDVENALVMVRNIAR